jgi:hypothetical protein
MKHKRTIEKLQGRGHIPLTGGKKIGVRYALVVFLTVDDEVDTGELAGQVEVRGAIAVDQAEDMVDLSGKQLMLKMNDGRCLEAWVDKGQPEIRQWQIVASGPKGLERC